MRVMEGVNTKYIAFKKAVNNIAAALSIPYTGLKFSGVKYKDRTLNYDAKGEGGKYTFDFIAIRRTKKGKVEVHLEIRKKDNKDNPFNFSESVEGFKTFERVAAGGVFKFKVEREPADLTNLFGQSNLYVLGMPRLECRREVYALLNNIRIPKGGQLEVYKFNHTEDTDDYYRGFSYAFKIPSEYGPFYVVFPELGGLDSGGAHFNLDYVERLIRAAKRYGKVVEENFYIEYTKLKLFLLVNQTRFYSYHDVEIDQYQLPIVPGVFGRAFDKAFERFTEKFYQQNFIEALGDIRALVQDALTISCEKKGVNIKDVKDPDPNNLVGRLIKAGCLDGRFQTWTGAFTAFANIGGHSRVFTQDELDNITFRRRIVLTILLGVHLITELDAEVTRKVKIPHSSKLKVSWSSKPPPKVLKVYGEWSKNDFGMKGKKKLHIAEKR